MGHFRRLAASVLALISTCSACMPAHGPAPQYVSIEDLKSETVALVEPTPIEDDGFGGLLGLTENHVYCSGVWIDANTIVTANHCVADLKVGDNVFYSTEADVSIKDYNEVTSIHMSDLVAM